MSEQTAVVMQEPPRPIPTDTLGIIALAVDKGMDPDKLTALVALHERLSAEKARREYNEAMAKAQSQMQVVRFNSRNKHIGSDYADLCAVVATITPIYSRNGFSLSFREEKAEKPDHLKVACRIAHAGGHCEEASIEIAIDGKGAKGGQIAMTATQASGSTVSYARRYLQLMIFNLAVGDDNDGNAPVQPITGAQATTITNLIIACGKAGKPVAMDKFLAWAEADSVESIASTNYSKVVDHLERRAKGGA